MAPSGMSENSNKVFRSRRTCFVQNDPACHNKLCSTNTVNIFGKEKTFSGRSGVCKGEAGSYAGYHGAAGIDHG